MYTGQSKETIFTNSSLTKFAKCSQTYSNLVGRVGCGGWGRWASLLLPPPPYPVVHVPVHLYSSQTLFAKGWWISPKLLGGMGCMSNSGTWALNMKNTARAKYNDDISLLIWQHLIILISPDTALKTICLWGRRENSIVMDLLRCVLFTVSLSWGFSTADTVCIFCAAAKLVHDSKSSALSNGCSYTRLKTYQCLWWR